MTDDPEDYCAAETVVMDPVELARLIREMRHPRARPAINPPPTESAREWYDRQMARLKNRPEPNWDRVYGPGRWPED